ncbi:hypothetical protein VKT23_019518 [Stygiomarasmius scandens]|uniref:Uncharacterized protein n=1 Tax=Marasmiellus scandens TaxID=2682957 RepID=A0ABR1IQB4_9AGAR
MSFLVTQDDLLHTRVCIPRFLDPWRKCHTQHDNVGRAVVLNSAVADIDELKAQNETFAEALKDLSPSGLRARIGAVLYRGIHQISPELPDSLRIPPQWKQWNPSSVMCHLFKEEYEELMAKRTMSKTHNLDPHNYARDELQKIHAADVPRSKAITDAWNDELRKAEASGTLLAASPGLQQSRIQQGIRASRAGIASIQQQFGIRQLTVLSWDEVNDNGVKHPKVLFLSSSELVSKGSDFEALCQDMLEPVTNILRLYYGNAPDVLRSQTITAGQNHDFPQLEPRDGETKVKILSDCLNKFVKKVSEVQTGHPYHKKKVLPWGDMATKPILTKESVPDGVVIHVTSHMHQNAVIQWYDHILARQKDGKPGIEFVRDRQALVQIDTVDFDEERLDYDDAEEPLPHAKAQDNNLHHSQPSPLLHDLFKDAIPFPSEKEDDLQSSQTFPGMSLHDRPQNPVTRVSIDPLLLGSQDGPSLATTSATHEEMQQHPKHAGLEITGAPNPNSTTPPSSPLSSVSSPAPRSPTVNGKRVPKAGCPRTRPIGSDLQQRQKGNKRPGSDDQPDETSRVKKRNTTTPSTSTQAKPKNKNTVPTYVLTTSESPLITLGFEYNEPKSLLVSLDSYAAEHILNAFLKQLKTPWKKMMKKVAWAYHKVLFPQAPSVICPPTNFEPDTPALVQNWALQFSAFVNQQSSSLLSLHGTHYFLV